MDPGLTNPGQGQAGQIHLQLRGLLQVKQLALGKGAREIPVLGKQLGGAGARLFVAIHVGERDGLVGRRPVLISLTLLHGPGRRQTLLLG